MSRCALPQWGLTFLVSVLGSGTTFSAPVLQVHGSSLTSFNGSATSVQKVHPLFLHRGSDLEGGSRMAGAPLSFSVGFASGMGAGLLNGIDLATLSCSQADVDIALPVDGPGVIIGRAYNHRQGSDSSVALSQGPQGRNWFQLAMPELQLVVDSGVDDIVKIVLGAGRYLEFKRTGGAKGTDFVGINGASGVVVYQESPGAGSYDTYTLTDSSGQSWVFWGDVPGSAASGQLWQRIDNQGRRAYAGHKTDHVTAVSSGYSTDGAVVVIYQEFGVGASAGERRYSFTYGASLGGVNRLTQVMLEGRSGGTWASPVGLVELARVSYEYYTSGTANGTDYHGDVGDLKFVRVRLPLTDSGTSLASGIFDERTKYYRYYGSGWADADGRRGHAGNLKLVLGFEGTRRYDWLDSSFDDTFASTAVSTNSLRSYSDVFFEYESSPSTQFIRSAFFNGECGCAGGVNGVYTFLRETSSSAATSWGNTNYDTAWAIRTTVTQPDGAKQVRYFDEVGQPLSSLVADGDPAVGATPKWMTGIVRNSNGQVTTIYSPQSVDSYTHSTGVFTFKPSAGLVTHLDRYASGEPSYDSSGELDGLVSGSSFSTGASGTKSYTSKNVLGKRSLTVGGRTVVRPLVTESRTFHTDTSSYSTSGTFDAVTTAYTWWNTTIASDPLYVAPKSVTTTLAAVPTSQNGANSSVNMVTYLRKDGRSAISVGRDGIMSSVKYNALGQSSRSVRDADPSVSSDFDTGYGPNDFGISTSANGGLRYATEQSYDSIGRPVASIARPDSSDTSVRRVSETYFSRLADRRSVVISTPRVVSGGSPTFYGPMGFGVSNHSGKSEFSATIAVAGTGITNAKSTWVDESVSDPITAIEGAGTANLAGTNRANLSGVSTAVLNDSGSKLLESRSYTDLPASGAWVGALGTNYDRVEYTYDDMGRVIRTKDATGTISRTVFDAIGRSAASWIGTGDANWTSSGNGAGDNMTQVSAVEYDGGLSGGNSLVTKQSSFVEGNSSTGLGVVTTARVTEFMYDVRGRRIVTKSPVSPHSVTKYDVKGRIVASAGYSSSSGLSATTDPTTTTTNRVSLSESFYDPRGQTYLSKSHRINQSTGASSDTLESTAWFDQAGRRIKSGGTSLSKTSYDRLGRIVNQFSLARVDDSTFSHAQDVAGDVVLEQSVTMYDDVDKTGRVMAQASISRHYDDTATGALDTNADGNPYAFTMGSGGDIKGRIQITSMWYDAWDRVTDSVMYGTYGNTTFDRRPSGAWLSVPNRGSGNILRTTTVYDSFGRAMAAQQPKIRTGTTPLESRNLFDHAGRKVAEIRNYTGGATATADREHDLYTRFTYSAGRLIKQWVDLDGDGVEDADDQVTEYTYGVTKTSTYPSTIASNHLMASITHPPQSSGQSVVDRSTFFAYNALGQKITDADPDGTIHQYVYDAAGRQTHDRVTSLGTNIDGAVRRRSTAFDNRGMISTISQFDNAAVGSGAVTDEVKYSYDDWGNLVSYQQDNDSAVAGSGGNSYDIKYAFAKLNDASTAVGNTRAMGIRRTGQEIFFGNGTSGLHEVTYTYLSSGTGNIFDSDVHRVSEVNVDNGGGGATAARYQYTGSDRVAVTTLVEPNITQRIAEANGNYAGWLDNFSRITTFRQKNESITGGGQYGQYGPSYDDNSNITGVESSWLTLNSMTLENDNVGRLLEAKVGVMVSGAITGSNIWNTEQWKDGSGGATGLTQTGNWKRYKNSRFDGSSTGVNIDGTMTFNLANEMTDKADAGITNSTNNPDPQPEYNKVGQLIKDDKTTANVGYRYTYDAWGRMRFARSHAAGNPVVQEYRYNGLGHQIARRFDANLDGVVDSSDPWRHSLYNERWQEVGVWHGSESLPREVFVMHAASRNGYGSSSYIDHVLLRDRDYRGGERDPVEDLPLPDGILEERNYILQNWRYDVIAVVTSIGDVVERRRYDAYGRPISVSPADVGAQGGVEGTDGYLSNNDAAAYNTLYFAGQVKWSTDLADGTTRRPSGTLNSSDYARFNDYFNDGYTGGIGKVSAAEVDIRRGYAGYQYDEILAGSGIISDKVVSKYNVRHRVLSSDDGKWNRRDPLGFVDGMGLYEYVRSGPMSGVDAMGLCRECSTTADVDGLVAGPIKWDDSLPSDRHPPSTSWPRGSSPKCVFVSPLSEVCTKNCPEFVLAQIQAAEFDEVLARIDRCVHRFERMTATRRIFTIECKDCSDSHVPSSGRLRLVLCNPRDNVFTEQTLIHELTHLAQRCEQGDTFYSDCDNAIRNELEGVGAEFLIPNQDGRMRPELGKKALCASACASAGAGTGGGGWFGPSYPCGSLSTQQCIARCMQM